LEKLPDCSYINIYCFQGIKGIRLLQYLVTYLDILRIMSFLVECVGTRILEHEIISEYLRCNRSYEMWVHINLNKFQH
jgi:hypothetical protein